MLKTQKKTTKNPLHGNESSEDCYVEPIMLLMYILSENKIT